MGEHTGHNSLGRDWVANPRVAEFVAHLLPSYVVVGVQMSHEVVGAERTFKRALEVAPREATYICMYGVMLANTAGREAEGRALVGEAERIDGRNQCVRDFKSST